MGNMKNKIAFIKEVFGRYYKEEYIPRGIPRIDKREFGFNLFEGFMLRHKKFNNYDELKEFLMNKTPMDAYYSCAYYENPEAEMDKKGWIGADLIFDIDADHIPTQCDKVHDEWTCNNCKFTGKGITPEKCPLCNGEKFTVITWPCEKCLNAARNETIKLMEFLEEDFGFSGSEIRMFFSGHRGYHIQVENKTVQELNAFERKEIVDYITGLGFEVVKPNEYIRVGWEKRAINGLCEFLTQADVEGLVKVGLKRNIAEKIVQNKDKLIKKIKSGEWKGIQGIGPRTLTKMLKHVIRLKSSKIDTVVTTDTHRLIRLPESLNSKTGFKKTELKPNEIDDFDPFSKAVIFTNETITVHVYDAPRFRIKNKEFGPYKNKKVELPIPAAMLILCKGKGEISE
ncbi:MAG: DNA primase small subunit PriS [Candidatus Bathyarchaeia archaeon]